MRKINLIFLLFILITPFFVQSSESKKVALVLGSGGNKGLAHVGVIEELERMGIIPDIIIGCSAGSIVGALYAQHKDIAKVKEILIDLKSDDLIDLSLFQKNAFSTSKKFETFLKENLDVTHIESLEIPFIAVATNLTIGEPVYFDKGNLIPVLLASSALPGVFPPVEMDSKIFIDGGVCDPLPISFAKKLEGYVVIASDISPSVQDFKQDNLVRIIRKAFETMYQRLAYTQRMDVDVLIEMNFEPELDSPLEDSRNQEIYEKGIETTRALEKEILKLIHKH